jgi:YidC/Oxa1 family membrane protein insertase
MNNPRTLLLFALLLVGYLMWMQWQHDYAAPPPPAAIPAAAPAQSSATTADAPAPVDAEIPTAAPAAGSAAPAAAPENTEPATPRVEVTTDVLRLEIDTRGGSIVTADLLQYPLRPKDRDHPVRLLASEPERFFEAQGGLISTQGRAPDHRAVYAAEQIRYALGDAAVVEVPLTWTDPSGMSVRKIFTLRRGSYVVEVRDEIANAGTTPWTGNGYRQLQRVPPVLETRGIKGYANTERYSFIGAAWYDPQDKYRKLAFDKFAKDPLASEFAGGWAAFVQHYFFAAWIPDANEVDRYETRVVAADGGPRYLIRELSPALTVAPGETKTIAARLYVGPKRQIYDGFLSLTTELEKIAPGLSLTVDYGIFKILAEPLHWILAQFHRLTGNWGFAIILLVLLIKAVFFKLSEAQYRSMAKMRKMQPRMQALKERYGDDRQKLNEAMLEFYKKEKINPLGGCLPMLIQMPVFFALYWVLLESVELRQAPFVGWIHNLTAPDPYFVLPILNAGVMLLTQHLTPTAGMDPMQARMMKLMPVVFSVLFAFFPAGLVLYWTANGLLSLAQQWIITRRIEAGAPSRA